MKTNTKIIWIVWAVLLLVYLYMAAIVMNGASESLSQSSSKPDAVKPLDLYMSGFSEVDVIEQMENMGKEGREVYIGIETHEDFIYPISYTVFLAFTLFFLGRFLFVNPWPSRLLLWLPVIAMVFDMMENHYLVNILQQYPELNIENVVMASMANQFKWGFALVSFGLVFVLGLWALVKRVRGRGQTIFTKILK